MIRIIAFWLTSPRMGMFSEQTYQCQTEYNNRHKILFFTPLNVKFLKVFRIKRESF